MDFVFGEIENQGIEIGCGDNERFRKKEMGKAIKKLKESNDDNKIQLAKRLARYYFILNNIGRVITDPTFFLKKINMG